MYVAVSLEFKRECNNRRTNKDHSLIYIGQSIGLCQGDETAIDLHPRGLMD